MRHVAVVGASLAGLSAAMALQDKEFLSGDMTEADLALESADDDLDGW